VIHLPPQHSLLPLLQRSNATPYLDNSRLCYIIVALSLLMIRLTSIRYVYISFNFACSFLPVVVVVFGLDLRIFLCFM
jgi:hypothetical protein